MHLYLFQSRVEEMTFIVIAESSSEACCEFKDYLQKHPNLNQLLLDWQQTNVARVGGNVFSLTSLVRRLA